MKNEMEHQLYVYQSLIFRSLLVDFVFTKGNAQNQVGLLLLKARTSWQFKIIEDKS